MSSSRMPRSKRPGCIKLGEQLTIMDAAALHRTLLARLQRGGPIVVDGSCVKEIDTAILQLLTSLWRSGAQQGIPLTWHEASHSLRKTAALLGLAEVLGLATDQAAPT